MHKVLLVDDEMFVRMGLRNLVDWETLGYTIVGEAENGEEAILRMRETAPDLVITDIRMPLVDGLELIKTSPERTGLDPFFIFISGYNDFTYAKQAIQYGVCEYILKPIDDGELRSCLAKIAEKLNRKKLAGNNQEERLKGSIIDKLIQGELGEEYIPSVASALNIEGDGPFYYVIAEAYDKHIAFQDIASAILMLGGIPVWEQQDGRCGMLLASGKGGSGKGGIKAKLTQLHAHLSGTLNVPLVLFAGAPAMPITSLKTSYTAALTALSHKYAEDGIPIVYYEEVKDKPLYELEMDQSLFNQLMEHIEENNERGYRLAIDDLFSSFRKRRYAPNAVWNAINRCMVTVVRVIQEMEGEPQQLQHFKALRESSHHSKGLVELKELFSSFTADASCYIGQLRSDQTKGSIEKIRKYIAQHYADNISLKSIAATFYMNPVYLGQLFRKRYGCYFNEFLLDLRLQEAKKLLRVSDLKMYEIAGRVGFQNADYFVSQFVKQEQMTPKEYRNRLIEKI